MARHTEKGNHEYCYVEGLATSLFSLPTEHAWVVNSRDEIIDPTRDFTALNQEIGYYGVRLPIDHMAVASSVKRRIADQWWRDEDVAAFRKLRKKMK